MRNIWEKVATVSLCVIGGMFVVAALLMLFGRILIFNDGTYLVDGTVLVLMTVLAIGFFALAAFVVYRNFSPMVMLKELMLHNDADCSTRITRKAVYGVIRDCADLVDGVRIRKTKIYPRQNDQIALKLYVTLQGDMKQLDTLRFLLAESFYKTLGFTFGLIEFEIIKFENGFTPDKQKASEKADTLGGQRRYTQDCFLHPILDDGAVGVSDEQRNVAESATRDENNVDTLENSQERETSFDEQTNGETQAEQKDENVSQNVDANVTSNDKPKRRKKNKADAPQKEIAEEEKID